MPTNDQRAIKLLKEAIREEYLRSEHWGISITNSLLAIVLLLSKDYKNDRDKKENETAQKLIEESIKIQKGHFSETHLERCLIDIALLIITLREPKKTRSHPTNIS